MKQSIISKIELVKSKFNITASTEKLFEDLLKSNGITLCELFNLYELSSEEIDYIYQNWK